VLFRPNLSVSNYDVIKSLITFALSSRDIRFKSEGTGNSGGLILIHNIIKPEGSRGYLNYICKRYSFAVMEELSMNCQGDRHMMPYGKVCERSARTPPINLVTPPLLP
jgi:hypothetical protein